MPSMGLRSGDTLTTIANTTRMSMVVGKMLTDKIDFKSLYDEYLTRNGEED